MRTLFQNLRDGSSGAVFITVVVMLFDHLTGRQQVWTTGEVILLLVLAYVVNYVGDRLFSWLGWK